MLKFYGFLAFMLACALLLSKWTEASLEFWLTLMKGAPVDVPYILAFILTFFTSVFGVLFNVVTELFKLIL